MLSSADSRRRRPARHAALGRARPFGPALSGDVSKLMIVIREADCFGTNASRAGSPRRVRPDRPSKGVSGQPGGLASPRMSDAFIGHSNLKVNLAYLFG